MDNTKWIRIIKKLKNIFFFLLAILVNHSIGQIDGSLNTLHSGSQCFHVKGVPTLKLRCPNGELIRVVESFYGTPIGGGTDGVCVYRRDENHCIQLMDMQENCMGRYMCSVYVSNPFLMNCRTYASYMQVNYTCVPRYAIHNICEPRTITTKKGYIKSPHYPDANYTSRLRCGCRLETNDAGMVLNILDFSVNHTTQKRCDADYLKVGHWGRKCGQIGPERLPESLKVDRQKVNLEFHTDAEYSSRGFWMEFSGTKGGEVSMTCGNILDKSDLNNMLNDNTNQGIRLQIHNGNIHTVTNSIYDDTTNTNIISTHNKVVNKVQLNDKQNTIETYELKHAVSELSPKDQYQSLSIHPKHLDTKPYLDEVNLPLLSQDDLLEIQKNTKQTDTEIDKAEITLLEKLEKELDSESSQNKDSIKRDDPSNDGDTVYTPHDGPWDIPGADGSSINNVVIKGDWNDDEEIIDIQHTLVHNVQTDPLSSSSSSNDRSTVHGRDKTNTHEDSANSETKDYSMLYGIDTVQITTGIVVGFLILIAVIIIIVLVFRRYPSRF